MKKIIIFILSLFIFIPNVDADSRNLVNIYLFHSNSCPHCKEEIKILDELEDRYDNIRVYKYEISDTKNSMLLSQVSEIYNTKITSVPFTIIGNKTFSGFSTETSKRKFIGAIEYFSNYGYVDKVADLQNLEKPAYQVSLFEKPSEKKENKELENVIFDLKNKYGKEIIKVATPKKVEKKYLK